MATPHKNGKGPVRLSLTMVVRNCAKTLEPLLQSIRPYAQEIIIGLGGRSDDATERVVRKYADVIVPCHEDFPADGLFDFASARNRLMPFVTGEYVCWFDGDDSLNDASLLPKLLDQMDQGKIDRLEALYEYDRDANGNVMVEHRRERILRTSKNWHWLDRLHETANTDLFHVAAYTDELVVIHHKERREGEQEVGRRNLAILEQMMREDPKPRTIIHLAHCYYGLAMREQALAMYERYMDAPEADTSHWSACIMASRCAVQMEDYPKAQSYAMVASQICPQLRDAYALLAQCSWYTEQDPEKAMHWVEVAKASQPAPLSVFAMPMDYQTQLWDIEHRVYAVRKEWMKALAIARQAVDLMPDSHDWKGFVLFYSESMRVEQSVQAALQLADHSVRHGDVTRAKMMLENVLPSTIRDDPRIKAAQYRVSQFLMSNEKEDYEEADHFDNDWDIDMAPRVQWYVDRLTAIGAKRVLEVGCHHGQISRHLASLGFECVGIDFNERIIGIANERAAGLNASFHVARLEEVDEQFDAVLLAEILEHVTPTQQMQMLNQAERLAPVILGSVPSEPIGMCAGLFQPSDVGNEHFRPHIFEFDQDDMETLILTDPARKIVNCFRLPMPKHWIPGYGNRVFEFRREEGEKPGLGVTILLGPGHEFWTPLDIEGKGVGGSETAAVRIAQDLSRRGHYVTVYGPEEGVYDGVVYRHWRKFNPDEAREVVIVSRDFMLTETRPNAAVVALWCHDIAYDDGMFTPEVAERFDKIVVMSEWQKDFWRERYPWLDEEKLTAIGNGLTIYPTQSERIRGRFIYSSSPDRGLDDVLERWPLIQEAFPDGQGGSFAELHVFYGWQYLDTVPQLRPFKQRVLALSKQDGVFMHGRIGQQELAEEFAKAQFWLYPSILPNDQDFHETFCISALEAQAYGTIPITRSVGGLAERYGDEAFLEPWNTGSIMQRIKEWNTKGTAEYVDGWRENAEAHTWQAVTDRWLALVAGQMVEKYLVEV